MSYMRVALCYHCHLPYQGHICHHSAVTRSIPDCDLVRTRVTVMYECQHDVFGFVRKGEIVCEWEDQIGRIFLNLDREP